MRARLFVITSLTVATVLGTAGVAAAQPNGPGNIGQKQPTTTTTAAPKGPDKVAPKPTTTTTTPPVPKGPDGLVNKPSDPVVDPGPDTTGNGSGSDNYVPPVDGSIGNPELVPVSDNGVAAQPADDTSSSLPTLVVVMVAGLVGAILALFASRFRRDDEHAGRV